MSESGRDTSKIKSKVTPFAVAVILAALFLGIAAGALAYRQHLINKNNSGKKSGGNNEQKQANNLAPIVGSPKGKGKPSVEFDAQFNTSSMWPEFSPDRSSYVTRCVPGRVSVQVWSEPDIKVKVWANPARSGRYAAEARILPGQKFKVKFLPKNGKEKVYEIRCLPADFPEWRYKQLEADLPEGMFMVAAFAKPNTRNRAWMMVFDEQGMPRYWYQTPTNTLGGQILEDGTLQIPRGFADGFGQDARTRTELRGLDGTLKSLVDFEGAPIDGHEYLRLPNGNRIVMSYKPRYGVDLRPVGGRANRGLLDGAIQEQTPSGEVVWEWNSKDHVSLKETPARWWQRAWRNPHYDKDGRIRYDQFHLNSIEPWRDMYVLSTRHTDSVWGISKKTGEVIWKFGGVPTNKSLKVIGDDPYGGYPISGNHDVRMIGNVLTVHDNGVMIKGRPTRALQYRINLKDRTATYIGDFQDSKASKSGHCCGSFRKMGDGWVVGWGASPWVTGFDRDGQIAFRLAVQVPPYRAVPLPANISVRQLDKALDAMAPEPAATNIPMRPIELEDKSNLQDWTIPGLKKLQAVPDERQEDLANGKGVVNP